MEHSSDQVLAQFNWDCGRSGSVEGLFVTTYTELEKTYGKNIYFGEILGKHSDVHGILERHDIEIKSEDTDFISKLVDILGTTNISGYNPFDYLSED